MTEQPDSIPLEPQPATHAAQGGADRRPRIPEPLPVRLIAVEDVRLLSPPGTDEQLDAVYVGMLEFERVENELAYRADNFILHFDVQMDRPVPHESLRPQGIEVLSLVTVEKKLVEAEIEYTRQRGLTPGSLTLLFLDPAGNWLEISERRIVP